MSHRQWFTLAVLLAVGLAGFLFGQFTQGAVQAQTFSFVQSRTATAVLTAGTNGLTTTPEVLRASLVSWECIVQNDPQSATDALVGDATSQTIQLIPGASITLPIQNATTINVVAVSGTPTVNYLCR